jgi:hypothetical protein
MRMLRYLKYGMTQYHLIRTADEGAGHARDWADLTPTFRTRLAPRVSL